MKRFNILVFGLLVLVAVGCGKQSPGGPSTNRNQAVEQAPASNPVAEKAAVESAQAWLELVDAGNYSQSWDEAAAYFKSAVSEADWEKAIQAVRPPLGKMVSRTIKSRQYMTSMAGAPDGEYVVIQYESTFENKAHAIETITPMRDKDGKWRVSGYYIK
jgi:hypothetical protein